MRNVWERDDVQFVRLLAEIKAVGLTAEQVRDLSASMDLDPERIVEVLDRAEDAFDHLKVGAAAEDTSGTWEVSVPDLDHLGEFDASDPMSHDEALSLAQAWGADDHGRIRILNKVFDEDEVTDVEEPRREAVELRTYTGDALADAARIAGEVVAEGASEGWSGDVARAAVVERTLAPFNIGYLDDMTGCWTKRSGGSSFFQS